MFFGVQSKWPDLPYRAGLIAERCAAVKRLPLDSKVAIGRKLMQVRPSSPQPLLLHMASGVAGAVLSSQTALCGAEVRVLALQYVKQVKDVLREVGELTAGQAEVLDISHSTASGSGDAPAQPAPDGQPAPNGVADHHAAALERLTLEDASSAAASAQRPCSNGGHAATEALAAEVQRSAAAEPDQADPPGQDGGAERGCDEGDFGDFEAAELTPPERDVALAAQQARLL